MKRGEVVKRVLLIAIILYVFLLSIKLMGGSFKLFGKEFAEQLITFTTNPLVGLFIGILATSLVQSSSATTSVIVGLVAAGSLSVGNAIPMIMGANIGTSITNTIVSLAHITRKDEFKRAFEVATIHDFFNFFVVLVLLPLELAFGILHKSAFWLTGFVLGSGGLTFKSPLDKIVKPVAKYMQHLLNDQAIVILIVSLVLLFFSLKYFVKVVRPLVQGQFAHKLNEHIFHSPVRTFGLGIFLTVLVQSSSVSTSLIVPLAGVGMVTLTRIFPYILGANIGTTITALLAASVTGSPAAVTIALAHLMFNVYGTAFVYPMRQFPISMSRTMAHWSSKHRVIPFTYIGIVFYAIPSSVIFLIH